MTMGDALDGWPMENRLYEDVIGEAKLRRKLAKLRLVTSERNVCES